MMKRHDALLIVLSVAEQRSKDLRREARQRELSGQPKDVQVAQAAMKVAMKIESAIATIRET